MGYLILEMREGSGWGDSESTYEFPSRYLRQFEEALSDGDVVALIYEPRREGGRQAFVAWTRITAPPSRSANGRDWVVSFDGGLRSFDRVVPLVIDGVPVEHDLRSVPAARRGTALQGRSVRVIPPSNALEILGLGSATLPQLQLLDGSSTTAEVFERGRRIVERLERDARFRDDVLSAYSFRCAVTGLALGARPASRLGGILDAAHIRPASRSGPSHVCNGIVLTPTVHRLFDAGLFTLAEVGHDWVLKLSSRLEPSMLNSMNGTRLILVEGAPIERPSDTSKRPFREFVEYHRAQCFVA